MTEPKRPLKVFLSYASQDRPLVRELSRRLTGEGWIDTWQDEKNLLPGQDWRVKIEEAVEDADVVIIVLSQHSVSKEGHVQKELRYAREISLEKPEDAIFLIPLRLDECEVPRGLRFYQWVDYFGDNKESSYKALVTSLNLRYEQKIKSEEAERLREEQQEREIAERIAREKAEKEASEKARLKVEKEERQRIAKEKADREAANKLAREKAEKEAAEKVRLEAEELAKQKSAKEKAERESAEKAWFDKTWAEAEERAKQKAAKEKKTEHNSAEKARLKLEEEKQERIDEEKVNREPKVKESHPKQEHEPNEKTRRGSANAEKVDQVKKNVKPEIPNPSSGNQVVYWVGGFVLLILGIFLLSSLNNSPSTPQPTPENTQTQTIATLVQNTIEPSVTAIQKITSTPVNTYTPTPLPTEISTTSFDCVYDVMSGDTLYQIAEKFGIGGENWTSLSCAPDDLAGCDMSQPAKITIGWRLIVPNVNEDLCNLYGEPLTDSIKISLSTEITDAKGVTMRLIPAGEFTMGSEIGDPDEQPVHTVYLDAFYMDTYEVTNAQYQACEIEGGCDPPQQIRSYTHPSYYVNAAYRDYPVINVNWEQAKLYCEWRGGGLPTEAQWEKAARGNDERTYPWGDDLSCTKVNYYGCVAISDVVPVGSYENGKSIYGIYDLAGNVLEWVADWYSETYYQTSPSINPLGPDSGKYRVRRGGSWNLDEKRVRSSDRNAYDPELIYNYVGFRCASDITP